MKIKILCTNKERDIVVNYIKTVGFVIKVAEQYDGENGEQSHIVYADIDIKTFSLKKAKPLCKYLKPTIDEIKNYCIERKNAVDPERFFDFYESKGWLVGRTKMKDWRASVRTWEKAQNADKAQYKGNISQSAHFPGERNYTKEELFAIHGDRADPRRLDDIEF